MTTNLFEALEAGMPGYTASERAIAHYILSNRSGIAYETATSIAAKLDVSAVTVGRFCRMLGYRHFRDLKEAARHDKTAVPWLVGDQLADYLATGNDKAQMKRSLELEIEALVGVYQLAERPVWETTVTLLAHAERIHIAGFQTERGIATTLAHLLQYVRDGVSQVDLGAGSFADVLATARSSHCLVIVDIRRYSRLSRALAKAAKKQNIPVVVITDKFCDWAGELTPYVLAVSTESPLFWSSSVGLGCLVNLLVNSVVGRLGSGVERRLERISELYRTFTGYVE